MKYFEEFRYGQLAKKLIKQIIAEVDRKKSYNFLDFCSSHAHPIHRYGLQSYLPDNLILNVVNRTASAWLSKNVAERALLLAKQPYVICCSYPEILSQNPDQACDLMQAKSDGADIRIVYAIDDAINLAKMYPTHQIVFIAIGFEGEMLSTAAALNKAKKLGLQNFSVMIQHKTAYTAACEVIDSLCDKTAEYTGLLLPVDFMENGITQYHALQLRIKKPILISGFEPVDILQSMLYLVRQNNAQDKALVLQHKHSIAKNENNQKQALLNVVFNNHCDPVTAPVCVQADYLPYTVMFSDSPQAESFFQEESETDVQFNLNAAFDAATNPIQ